MRETKKVIIDGEEFTIRKLTFREVVELSKYQTNQLVQLRELVRMGLESKIREAENLPYDKFLGLAGEILNFSFLGKTDSFNPSERSSK